MQTDTPLSSASVINIVFIFYEWYLYENVILTGQSYLLALFLPIQTINNAYDQTGLLNVTSDMMVFISKLG